MGKIGKYIGVIGAGIAAIGYVGWRMLKNKVSKEIPLEENESPIAPAASAAPAKEAKPPKRKQSQSKPDESTPPVKKPRAIPEAEKTSLLNGIAAALKEQNTDAFTIRFGQSKQRGYRGYYLSGMTDAAVFVGWSKEFESVYGMTPFWIELDEAATARFKESGGLDGKFDLYPHPASPERILIALSRESAKKPEDAAASVLEIARATLV